MKTTAIFRFIIAATAVIAVFSSCRKEPVVGESASGTTDGVRVISVQFDNSTKATLSGVTPTFTNNDKIRVSNSEKSEECTVTVSGTSATFTTTLSGELPAIYPTDAAVLSSSAADAPIAPSNSFKVSAVQDGTARNAMIARATDADKRVIKAPVLSDGKSYVSLVPGVKLSELLFDAYLLKKEISATAVAATGRDDITVANTKYPINSTRWEITAKPTDMDENNVF